MAFTNNNLIPDSIQNHSYEIPYSHDPDSNFNDPGWAVHPSPYHVSSRGQPASAPGWQPNANHLSAASADGPAPGQSSSYAAAVPNGPAVFGSNGLPGYGNQPGFHQPRPPQYDPALLGAMNYGVDPSFNYFINHSRSEQNPTTIAPNALQHEGRALPTNSSTTSLPQSTRNQWSATKALSPSHADHKALVSAIPKSLEAGHFAIVDSNDLAKATNSEPMATFLNVAKQAFDFPINRTVSLPAHVPRKSKNELRRLAGNDGALLAKIGKKMHRKSESLTLLRSDIQPSSKTVKPPIKYDQDVSSDAESSDDDDDDSSHTSDEDPETSPLPSNRPESPKAAVEYDAAKALWRSKRKPITSDAIKTGLTEFWEVVKTIRDRWKIDAAAVLAAEESKKVNELPLLKSRVKDQRDMIEVAFRAALKHGHRSTVELFSENLPLLHLCYQFLLDRLKQEDLNGTLSRAMLETLSLCTTLSNEKLEKVHLNKVLSRYMKNGDLKTQFFAKRINANAAALSKEQAALPKKNDSASVNTTASTQKPTNGSEPVTGIKRTASGAPDGRPQKKFGTAAAKAKGITATSKSAATSKKTASFPDAKLASAPTSTAPVTKTKQVTAKPSGFFSSLQSASKKPGTSIKTAQASQTPSATSVVTAGKPTGATNAASKSGFSFAETMANLAKPKEEHPAPKPEKELPPETEEQKAKRLRKEARRGLHVSFKSAAELVEVRYFTHDPEEEIDHDSSQMRDVGDIGGEGRMLKQHRDMMDIDDEDEANEVEQKLREFKTPSAVDFSAVDAEELKRNFAKFGGLRQADSPEKAERGQLEASTLMVVYATWGDIPPNPREPQQPYGGVQLGPVVNFGAPDKKYEERAHQRRAAQRHLGQTSQSPAPQPTPAFDISALAQAVSSQHRPSQPAPAPTQDATTPNIQDILAKLNASTIAQPQQPVQASMTNYNAAAAPPPPLMNGAPTPPFGQPNGQLDLNSILAQLQGQQQQPPAPPQMGAAFAAAVPAPMTDLQADAQNPAANRNADRKRWRDQGPKNLYYKTKVCRYWEEGRCMKGDDCTYLHEKPPQDS